MQALGETDFAKLSVSINIGSFETALKLARAYPQFVPIVANLADFDFAAALKDGNVAILNAARCRKNLPKMNIVPALGEALLKGQLELADWIMGPFDLGKLVSVDVIGYMLNSRSDWWTSKDVSFRKYKKKLGQYETKNPPNLPKDVWDDKLIAWLTENFPETGWPTFRYHDDMQGKLTDAMEIKPLNLKAFAWLLRFYGKQVIDYFEEGRPIPSVILGLVKVGFLADEDAREIFVEDRPDTAEDEDSKELLVSDVKLFEELSKRNLSIEELERMIEDDLASGRYSQ